MLTISFFIVNKLFQDGKEMYTLMEMNVRWIDDNIMTGENT